MGNGTDRTGGFEVKRGTTVRTDIAMLVAVIGGVIALTTQLVGLRSDVQHLSERLGDVKAEVREVKADVKENSRRISAGQNK